MEPLGYYKWHWQAWRANRRVQRMSCLQKGIYRELLDECWADGSIPDDILALADIAGCTEQELADAWQLLSTCFYEVAPGRLTNRKLEEQRTETDTLRATRARAGEAGGKQKLANAKQVSSTCHIEEKSREEKSKPSRAVRTVHPLFAHVKDLVERYYRNRNQVQCPWGAGEAKQLSALLAEQPDAQREHWNTCIVGRSTSDVNHADRPRLWIANLSSYRNAVNAFKQPKENDDGTPRNYRNPTKSEITMAAAQNAARFDSEAAIDPRNRETGYAPGAGIFDLLSGIGRVSDSGSVGSNRPALPPGRADGQNLDAEPWIDGYSVPSGQ